MKRIPPGFVRVAAACVAGLGLSLAAGRVPARPGVARAATAPAGVPLAPGAAGEERSPGPDADALESMLADSRVTRKVAWTIDPEDGAAIAAATDGSFDDVVCYEGQGIDPRLHQAVDLSWVVAWGASGASRVRVAVASAPGGKVLAVTALEAVPEGAAKPEAFSRFLGQFSGRFGLKTTSNSWNPLRRLEERMEAARDASTEEGRKLSFLVRQLALMRRNQEVSGQMFPAIQQKKAEDAATAAREIASAFRELQSRRPDVTLFLGKEAAGTYEDKAAAMERTMDAVAAAAEKKDWSGAVEILRTEVQRGCGACHGWDGHPLGGTLQAAFGMLRGKMDIGPGYFVVGHDVQPDPKLSSDEQQAAALAVKKALLLPLVADLEDE